MAIASLVLGIAAVVFAVIIPAYGWLGIILGIIGIVLAVMAKKQAPNGMATAGLVLSIIGTALAAIFWIACIACYAAANNATNGLLSQLK